MHPEELFWGIDLYSILIALGILGALVVTRVCADRVHMPAKMLNLCLIDAVASVLVGYGSAVLWQAFYNFMKTGTFELASDTGSTFYGGLIGGAIAFFLIYFLVGRKLFPDRYHISHFIIPLDIAPCCVTIAHGFGRLGCLMAGCCHGKETDAWYGIYMVDLGHKVVPLQLYEAIFLLALCAFLMVRFFKGRRFGLPIYMVSYGVWRFIIEFFRGDERGATLVPFLSPSQLVAILMVAGAFLVYWAERKFFVSWLVRAEEAGKKSGDDVPPENPAPAES